MKNETIEGELAEPSSNQGVVKHEEHTAAVFNPLDAEPVAFTRQLQTRQSNYNNLREHLFGELVPGKDFGKIHVAKDCENKYRCKDPYHFSGYELFAPGADKILGILGLWPEYPGYEDYIRASVKGLKVEEVIIKCEIIGQAGGAAISNGMGACERKEEYGNLNKTLKKACKRARVDAVKRLPTISALFEDNILEELEAAAKRNELNAFRKRRRETGNLYDTGANLDVCPIGTHIKGKKWRDIETNALEWLVANVDDKPDVTRAAQRELEKRTDQHSTSGPAPASGSSSTAEPPASPDTNGKPDIGFNDLEDYEEWA